MIRPKIICAMVAIALIIAGVSCQNDKNDVAPTPSRQPSPADSYESENTEAISKALIAGKAPLKDAYWNDGYSDFSKKINLFSNKVATKIGFNQDKNIAVSPLSIFMALSMAADCANGDTRQELLDALGITYEELIANISLLNSYCNTIFSDTEDTKKANMIKCVNSLWLNANAKAKQDGVNSLNTLFYTDVFKLLPNTDINKTITSYIKNETNGLLSPDLQIKQDTYMVLMNVVYLRDIWNLFANDLELTTNKYKFRNYDNSISQLQLLTGTYFSGKAVSTDSYRKFYTRTNNFTLTFYVPNEGHSVDEIYNADVLNDDIPYTYEDEDFSYTTRCLFPEFTAEYDENIAGIINDLGVKKFFIDGECDFSHITDAQVCCSKIKHVTKLDVKRSGIEGAAVTAVSMVNAALGHNKKEINYDFVVDRSFAYVLSYKDVPVFTGVVKNVE